MKKETAIRCNGAISMWVIARNQASKHPDGISPMGGIGKVVVSHTRTKRRCENYIELQSGQWHLNPTISESIPTITMMVKLYG